MEVDYNRTMYNFEKSLSEPNSSVEISFQTHFPCSALFESTLSFGIIINLTCNGTPKEITAYFL